MNMLLKCLAQSSPIDGRYTPYLVPTSFLLQWVEHELAWAAGCGLLAGWPLFAAPSLASPRLIVIQGVNKGIDPSKILADFGP